MGSSASKPVQNAASAAARRQYPKTPSSQATSQKPPRFTGAPNSQMKSSYEGRPQQERMGAQRPQEIDLDARDPHFDAHLRSIGAVNALPTWSKSSTAKETSPHLPGYQQPGPKNPSSAISTLESRARLARAATEETEGQGRVGHLREFLDIQTVKQVLLLRDQRGMSTEQIEKALRLKPGVVERLGAKGIASNIPVANQQTRA